MRFRKNFLAAAIALIIIGVPLEAQVEQAKDIVTPPAQFQDQGGVTPWFWIGLQTVFSGGYNLETGAAGFRNYGGDNYTYASFNLAFVDSRYQTPKFYEVPKDLDPNAWTGHFVFINFTSRLNSFTTTNQGDGLVESNSPAWLAEISGRGVRIGFFTQAANLVGSLFDSNRASALDAKPITSISGGNMVLNLQENELGKVYYENNNDPNSTTSYSTANGAIWYAGYEKKELWNAYLTMLSEGNVNSDVTGGKNNGFAGVIDFNLTPFGLFTDSDNHLTLNLSGNAISGFGWENVGSDTKNTGFGLQGGAGFWLGRDNLVLSPVAAFDGKVDSNNKFLWKAGGGLTLQFSGMRWVNDSDDWGDLQTMGANPVAWRYENNQVLKYAYAQVYGAYSDANDLNMLFRIEEPDGDVGFNDKLGFMGELRLYNVTEKVKPRSWAAQGRVSWDFNVKEYLFTPYVRGYLDSASVMKLRLGVYANIIPFTGFELAYTSANLNRGANVTDLNNYVDSSYPYRNRVFDAGRIEFIVILKSDDARPHVPKRMSDWNYPSVVQDN